MSNCYRIVTAEESVKCSKKNFLALQKLWEPEGYDAEGFCLETSGIELEYIPEEKGLYLYSEEFGDIDNVPEAALKKLGEIIKAAGKEYLEFGVAEYCDRARADSANGGRFRVYANGTVKHPKRTWD